MSFLPYQESQCLALALAQRLREGSLPPDDAYAWTRIVCEALGVSSAQTAERDMWGRRVKAAAALFANRPHWARH